MQDIIAIVGPTASGKTGLSVAMAKHFGADIVSADSMQIYREMNIGTAKPSMEERCGVRHHLMGHVGVEQSYNVVSYVKDARAVLDQLYLEQKLPILCGGTGLYVDHLLSDTDFFDIPFDAAVRARFQAIANEQGPEELYFLLKETDPVLAEKLHPNDIKRVIRGLEVFETTGRKLSDYQSDSHRESPFRVLYLGLNYKDRSILYDRINKRVDLMVEDGLIREVRELMENYALSDTARAAIGYKEIIDCIEAGGELSSAIELIKQKSRNYAKRQLTWFGKNKEIHWLYPDETDCETLHAQAIELIGEFLKGGNE